jgi:hypothetical protein
MVIICTSQGGYVRDPSRLAWRRCNQLFPSFTAFGVTLKFNNTAFINAFSQGFVCFATNLDPNENLPPSITPSITPMLPKWSRGAEAEMAFNKTDAGNCTGECAAE